MAQSNTGDGHDDVGSDSDSSSDSGDGEWDSSIDGSLSEFDPDPREYSTTQLFVNRRRGKLKNIFSGDVIGECFDGEARPANNDCIRLIGTVAECHLSLIVDPEEKLVVEGEVLQVNPVQAAMHGPWDKSTIERMQGLAKQHEGKVWNAHEDPRIGNSEKWYPDDQYDTRTYE